MRNSCRQRTYCPFLCIRIYLGIDFFLFEKEVGGLGGHDLYIDIGLLHVSVSIATRHLRIAKLSFTFRNKSTRTGILILATLPVAPTRTLSLLLSGM